MDISTQDIHGTQSCRNEKKQLRYKEATVALSRATHVARVAIANIAVASVVCTGK